MSFYGEKHKNDGSNDSENQCICKVAIESQFDHVPETKMVNQFEIVKFKIKKKKETFEDVMCALFERVT